MISTALLRQAPRRVEWSHKPLAEGSTPSAATVARVMNVDESDSDNDDFPCVRLEDFPVRDDVQQWLEEPDEELDLDSLKEAPDPFREQQPP
jgi:hypothetical protein